MCRGIFWDPIKPKLLGCVDNGFFKTLITFIKSDVPKSLVIRDGSELCMSRSG